MDTESRQGAVAVLGCGLMGSAVARAFAAAGHDLVVWNRTPAKAEALVREGVRAASSAQEAVASAEVVVSVLADYPALLDALGEAPLLEGRVLVVLSNGSASQAGELQAWATARGAGYLDGVIGAFPEEVGAADCSVSYAGREETYRQVEPVLRALGGGTAFVSEDVGSVSALDLAVVGMFFAPALVGFAEAAGYLHERGIDLDVVGGGLERTLGILHHQMQAVLAAVRSGDHSTEQATVDTFFLSSGNYLDELQGEPDRGRLLVATHGVLEDVVRAGLGQCGMSVIATPPAERRAGD